MRKYMIVVEVDENKLMESYHGTETSVSGALETEFGWLMESGIDLIDIREMLENE